MYIQQEKDRTIRTYPAEPTTMLDQII
jgi:hypothetical protein